MHFSLSSFYRCRHRFRLKGFSRKFNSQNSICWNFNSLQIQTTEKLLNKKSIRVSHVKMTAQQLLMFNPQRNWKLKCSNDAKRMCGKMNIHVAISQCSYSFPWMCVVQCSRTLFVFFMVHWEREMKFHVTHKMIYIM